MTEYREALDWWNSRKKATDTINVYYTADAFVKQNALVQYHKDEVGWNLVIKPYKDGYIIKDVLVYPQKVSPAFISVDTAKYGLWKATLTDEQDANLFGHGHSHVNMNVSPSGVDIAQQYEELSLKKGGFWLFQICNKKGDINSFLYDLEKDVCYETENIQLIVETEDGDLWDFVEASYGMLTYDSKVPDET